MSHHDIWNYIRLKAMIEGFPFNTMKVRREAGHIVFKFFFNLVKTWGIYYLSVFLHICQFTHSQTFLVYWLITTDRGVEALNLINLTLSLFLSQHTENQCNTRTCREIPLAERKLSENPCLFFTLLSGKTDIVLALPIT